MKLYTGVGDAGETGLMRGERISKASALIEAIGAIDEVNAAVGLARAHPHVADLGPLDGALQRIQEELFEMGAALADLKRADTASFAAAVSRLEGEIDDLCAQAPPIKHFILPAGDEGACRLHVARTVARSAERALVRVCETVPVDPNLLAYLNRLSDLLFAAARAVNAAQGHPERPWGRNS